ncbi:hypothetical protein HRI_002002200 [Hibiscus trionum]|uniref:Transmembrane protein n=1 Tax=Hibiscus trionum TaxID=183268 RepID=A0A9W7M060_HIBTR|nr:hypothetical protein HRI_002002200 [Hibiscus trionum]
MYKNQSPYTNKSPLLSNPHYKISVASATATNPTPVFNFASRHEPLLSNPHPTPTFPSSFFAPARLMLTTVSWLRTRRRRCLILLLCSPLLIPFLCATFPLLCLAEVCLRICRRSSSGKLAAAQGDEENRIRRCEEGCCGDGEGREAGLLQRYLEDQLALVGSVYDCGVDLDDRDHQDLDLDCKSPLLS